MWEIYLSEAAEMGAMSKGVQAGSLRLSEEGGVQRVGDELDHYREAQHPSRSSRRSDGLGHVQSLTHSKSRTKPVKELWRPTDRLMKVPSTS